jgi:uncharacterized protein (DUF488 family)
MKRVCTIGYTKKDLRTFMRLLEDAGVTKVIDIRLRNTSQLAGFAKKDDLSYVLSLRGIQYAHVPDLAPTDEMLDSYRSTKDWRKYQEGFRQLLEERGAASILGDVAKDEDVICLLCAEPTPEHCHRGIVAEYLKARFTSISIDHLV